MRARQKTQGLYAATLAVAAVLALVPVPLAAAAELLMFEHPGCPWCERWRAEVGPGYAKSKEGQQAPLRRLDLAHAARAGVTLVAPVTVSPTFVLADQGREVGRITGYPGPDFFWGLLDELLRRLPPERQRTGSASAAPANPSTVRREP